MGTKKDVSARRWPSHRKHKRSLQTFAALLVLSLPTAFLLFGGQWLAAAGWGPPNNTRTVAEKQSLEALERMEAAKAETMAREAIAAERSAAAALAVPAYIPSDPLPIVPGQTVVSLTFDDGVSGAARAAEILSAVGMSGTFYVNSGWLDETGFMTLRQAKEVAGAGHEVGGHTFSHPDLDSIDLGEAEREICQDRENLLSLGFQATNFAYPFSSGAAVKSLVADCGYNSGRGLGGTFNESCQNCPQTESLRPADPNLLKASTQVESDWTLADLQAVVLDGEAAGGGWVILTFHGLCPYQCTSIDIDESLFQEFIDWLAVREATLPTVVHSVQEVVGGPLTDPVSAAAVEPAAPGVNGIKNPGLEDWQGENPHCWARAGYGSNIAAFDKAVGTQGSIGAEVTVRSYESGDAKLTQAQDLGACSPAVQPGHRYSLRLSYMADVHTQFSVYYRDSFGEWQFWVASPFFDPSKDFAPAKWTTPPVPEGATGLTYGLSLSSEGSVVTDDYALYDAESAPPAPAATGVPAGRPADVNGNGAG